MKYCKQQESLMDTRVRDMVQITKMVLDAMKAPANNTVLAPANPVGATNVNAVNTNAVGGVNANAVGGVMNGLNTNTANINGMGGTMTGSEAFAAREKEGQLKALLRDCDELRPAPCPHRRRGRSAPARARGDADGPHGAVDEHGDPAGAATAEGEGVTAAGGAGEVRPADS